MQEHAPQYIISWTDDSGKRSEQLGHGRWTLGRAQGNKLIIQNKGISRKHARITVLSDHCELEDLESAAGTFYNGDYLTPHQPVSLFEGDTFSLGRIRFSWSSTSTFNALTAPGSPEAEQNPTHEIELLIHDTKQMYREINQILQTQPQTESILIKMLDIEKKLEKQLIQYRILQRVTQVLGEILDIRSLLKISLKLVGEELGADRGYIVLYDSSIHKMNSMVTWHYDLSTDTSQHDYTFSHTLATESVQSRKILIIDNAMEDPRFQSSQSIFASRILSVICIPLYRGKDVLGVIYLDNLKKEGQFHDVHENFLKTFAHQSSMALHNAKLYTQAVTDDLSGLFLRKYMERRIREELARVDRHQGTCSLLMIDIDFFKHVNDTYGHIAGDKVITEIARRLQSTAREMDVVGRFGGEEFLMLLPETRKEGALIMAERIRKKLSTATFQAEGRTFSITASIGIACSSSVEHPNTEKFIQAADKGLYTAKETGRNRCVVYSPSSTPEG